MKKIDKFEVAPGFMLFVEKQSGQYLLKWSHVSDITYGYYWPHGDNKILMHTVSTDNDVYRFIFDIANMFGVKFKDVSEDYPSMELVIEFV